MLQLPSYLPTFLTKQQGQPSTLLFCRDIFLPFEVCVYCTCYYPCNWYYICNTANYILLGKIANINPVSFCQVSRKMEWNGVVRCSQNGGRVKIRQNEKKQQKSRVQRKYLGIFPNNTTSQKQGKILKTNFQRFALLAQSVARVTLNHKVRGSSPLQGQCSIFTPS